MSPRDWARRAGRPLVLGHRGASHLVAENSLLAMRRAADEGADGVEFDVQPCGTGELVVFHDTSLGRATGRTGYLRETPRSQLADMTLDRLDLEAGREPSGQHIPTLEAWLAAVPPGLLLNLEIKANTAAQAGHGATCAEMIARAGLADRTVLSAFHPAALHSAWSGPSVARGALFSASPGWQLKGRLGGVFGTVSVHPEHTLVSPSRVRRWHARGLAVLTWTVDDVDEARRCLEAGVDGIITNRPEVLRPIAEGFPAP